MRKYSPRGPLVNSEFYPGFFSQWGQIAAHVETTAVLRVMNQMFDLKANFNFYMFFGGTSFRFTSGNKLKFTEREREIRPGLVLFEE